MTRKERRAMAAVKVNNYAIKMLESMKGITDVAERSDALALCVRRMMADKPQETSVIESALIKLKDTIEKSVEDMESMKG